MVAVETFECMETSAEPIEACEEAVGLIEDLELEGQLSLVRTKTTDKFAVRCPYREITSEENFVYRTLCPTTSSIKNYSASPLPLRVLQILSHAKSLGIFTLFEIWDRESVSVKDPVLVAYNGETWSSQTKCFILARWGLELETFATLLTRAVEAKKAQLVEGIKAVKARVDNDVSQILGMTSQQIISAGPDAKIELRIPGERSW